MRFRLELAAMVMAVVFSAIWVSWSVHQTRHLTNELQFLQRQYDALQTQWGQLLLEHSTWGGYARVERLAREKLGMKMPGVDQTVMVLR
jgi:cell division protein FtsL